MLKKAGIIVATAAAGLLAVSSFAYADETVTDGNSTNTCAFGQEGGAISNEQLGGSAGLGAVANAITSVITTVQAQAPIGNCTNIDIEDVLDSGSNNPETSETVTEIVDSNNE